MTSQFPNSEVQHYLAASMAGPYNGCPALTTQMQPLAIVIHYGAHSANLVLQHTLASTPQLNDAIQWVNELETVN